MEVVIVSSGIVALETKGWPAVVAGAALETKVWPAAVAGEALVVGQMSLALLLLAVYISFPTPNF